LSQDLPLAEDDREKLGMFSEQFELLCDELASGPVAPTIQHDDLHMNNVYDQEGTLRVLDWGDSSISHPFASLVATFRFLEERNGIAIGNPWRARIRDAYLEPWGTGLTEVFELAIRVGAFAHVIAALRQRRVLEGPARARFDEDLAIRLQRAIAHIVR
jgi:aminoglycoside phosphotransferase (APT) family kinase protein